MDRSRFGHAGVGMRVFWMVLAATPISIPSASHAQLGRRPPQDDMRAFPPARAGEARRVVRLPAERDEDGLRVGLAVGRTMWVDCNRQIFPARIDERTAEGWGYNYYVVTVAGAPASTRMACPGIRRTRQFVRAAEEPLVRYNSRVPLVIFAPADVEVRYRIWRAGAEATAR